MNNKPSPPKLLLRFFRWFCHPELHRFIEGDLLELYEERMEASGRRKANIQFALDVLLLFRPGIIRPVQQPYLLNYTAMFKSYFKISWRNMLAHKLYSAIKTGGLAIGIAACLLITLFIKNELSYDMHYPDSDRIYRVLFEYSYHGEHGFGVATQAPLAAKLTSDFPEVEIAGRLNPYSFMGAGGKEVRFENQQSSRYEEHTAYADPELLKVLQPVMVEGNLHRALSKPATVVITKSKANLYFPGESALGKVLIFNEDNKHPYTIDGVIEDFPENSHLNFDFLLTLSEQEFWKEEQQSWLNTNYFTYVKIAPGTNVVQLESKLATILLDYCTPAISAVLEIEPESIQENFKFHLQPIRDVHLNSTHTDDMLASGDIKLVWLFGAIAFFILSLASINFINLSTAKSANRAKEVGLRKTLGSLRSNLVQQFLAESVLFSMIGFLVGVLLAWLLLPYFNSLAAKSLIFPWKQIWFVPSIFLVALLLGVSSGLYPAFYLSAFKPAKILKGSMRQGSGNAKLRNGLVVFQFGITIVLLIGTLVVNQQMNFILNASIGFEKDQVILLQGVQTLGNKVATLKTELLKLPDIERVSVSDYLPITGPEVKRNGTSFWKEGQKGEIQAMGQLWQVDEDYVGAMGMNILKGKDFSRNKGFNREKAIINETLAQKLGLDNPIGQLIEKNGGDGGNKVEIIGVVEDFNFQSFKENIGGLCLIIGNSPSIASLKVRTGNVSHLLPAIEEIWNQLSPTQPIRYDFLDERFAVMYGNIQQMERVFFTFALLAVIVACSGLFALAAFMAEQRSKEMSIRKVLGASVSSIYFSLTWGFLKLVLFALIIAFPIAWYIMQQWLTDFAYRIELAWWFFGAAAFAVIGITLLTISSQALKLSFANPVDSLRNE
ncbi:ABC transporter permease [Tunicatimonas pelagia]|uniref:ABC transporter permease n=1 Tax=Tunicatimonas pelagia TaxID=931531 RepID=UPI002664F8F7|nr:ABC transporter permease [Tunicatimonas pelagia]WKN43707.1 ABC transporter permease [Tunicatimonas pelagia]